jgi:thioredoxin 1
MKTESIYDVEEATFDKLVIEKSHEAPVLVDISAEWCAPCKVLGPLLHKLADAYSGKFLLALVDADENMRSVEIDRFHSAQTEGYLRNFLDSVIKRHAEVV